MQNEHGTRFEIAQGAKRADNEEDFEHSTCSQFIGLLQEESSRPEVEKEILISSLSSFSPFLSSPCFVSFLKTT